MSGIGPGSSISFLTGLVLLLCGSMSGVVRGQTSEPARPDPTTEAWRTTSYDDLRGRGVYGISGGAGDRIWFATSAGVASYDGVTWRNWSLEDGLLDERFNVVLELGDGSVLAGGRVGLSRYVDGRWTVVLGRHSGPFWAIGAIAEASDGSVWVTTSWGVLRLRGERRTLYCTETARQALEPFELNLEFQLVPDDVLPESPWGTGIGVKLFGNGEDWVIIAVAENSAGEAAGLAAGDRVLAMRKDPTSAKGEPVFLLTCSRRDGPPFEVRIPRTPHPGSVRLFRTASVVEGPDGTVYLGARRGAVFGFNPSLEGSELAWSLILPNNRRGAPARVTAFPDGSIWAASDGMDSIVRIDTDERVAVPAPTPRGVSRLGGGGVESLWVLSDGRLFSRRSDDWRAHEGLDDPDSLLQLHVQPPGVLWVTDRKAGLTRIEFGTERLESFADLQFLCRTPGGEEWFYRRGEGLLVRTGETWERRPAPGFEGSRIVDAIVLTSGDLLAYASVSGSAIMARWSDGEWKQEEAPDLSIVGARYNLLCEGADGRLWFGPGYDDSGRAGVLVGEAGAWRRILTPPVKGVGIATVATEDGSIWLGTSRRLYRLSDEIIEEVSLPWGLTGGGVTALCRDSHGRLWAGTKAHGSYCRENGEWRRLHARHLPRNHVMDLRCAEDGTVWAATHAGLCRLDEDQFRLVESWFRTEGVRLRPSTDGSLWIHEFRDVIRFRPETTPPVTWLNTAASTMARPGPLVVAWDGRDPWRPGTQDDMTWSHRGDDGEWSPFSSDRQFTIEGLGVGRHRLEVRARDSSFNIDPTPALTIVEVILPIWQRTWFLLLVGAFLGTVVLQTVRMSRRDRRLREAKTRAEVAEAAKEQIEAEVLARIEAEEAHRQLEAELIQSRKMEAMGQLAGGIAHDFNNILTAIWGNASELSHLLEHGPYRDPQAVLALDGIHTAADRAAALTRQLLMVGRRQVVRPEVLDPNVVIEQMTTMLKRVLEEHVSLELLPGESSGSVLVDRSMFEQVIMNLVVNARDAMPGGGRIIVKTEAVVLGEKDVTPHPHCKPGAYFKLSVEDEGEGMSEETMERVFDPFYTTKPTGKGTGLGLSTVFAIARQCSGFVTVSSELGVGSRFEVYLPSSVGNPSMMPESETLASEVVGGSETILICEDDPTVREFVDRVLERYGYEVLTASSGEDALDLATSYEGPIALLLTDVIMPGMNGRELADAMRVHRPEIDVLYMSGHTEDVLADRSELAEGIDLLHKPFTTKTLLDRVRANLEPV